MQSFRERFGFIEEKNIQKDGLDKKTRNRLWNIILETFSFMRNYSGENIFPWRKFSEYIWDCFFKQPIDEIPYSFNNLKEILKNKIISEDVEDFLIFDFIEYSIPFFSVNSVVQLEGFAKK